MAQESVLRIVIDSRNAERNAHALANELESIEKNGNFATKSMDSMSVATRQLAGYMAGIVTVGAAINRMDAYTSINNKLKLVTNSQTELNQAMQDTFAIAQRSASSWSAVNDVYSKYMSNAKTLNLTQEQTARLTEITSKAVAISGSTTESAAGALFQYGQALDGNILRGEEYNALVDGAGGLLSAMAKGLNVTRGELRQMMLDGKLTGEVITKALLKAGDSVDELHAKTDVTIGSSLVVLGDSVTKFVGEASTGSGAATVLAGSIKTLAENLDLIADIAVVGGVALLTKTILTQAVAIHGSTVATMEKRAADIAALQSQAQLAAIEVQRTRQVAALAISEVGLARQELNSATTRQARAAATMRLTQAEIALAIAEKQKTAATAADTAIQNANNAARSRGAALLGLAGGWTGVLTIGVAGLAAGYMYLKNRTAETNAKLEEQGKVASIATEELLKLEGAKRGQAKTDLAESFDAENKNLKLLNTEIGNYISELSSKNTADAETAQILKDVRMGTMTYDEALEKLNKSHADQPDIITKMEAAIVKYKESAAVAQNNADKQKAMGSEVRVAGNEAQNSVIKHKAQAEAIEGVATAAKAVSKAMQDYYTKTNDSALEAIYKTALLGKYTKEQVDALWELQKAKGLSAIVTKDEMDSALRTADLLKTQKDKEDDLLESKKQQTKEMEKQAKQAAKQAVIMAGSNEQTKNMLKVYQAFKNAGVEDIKARVLTAQVGREGDFLNKNLFGSHPDAANNKTNSGMISWQGSRSKSLTQYLQGQGVLDKKGNIEQTQEALNAQAKFFIQEIMTEKRYSPSKNALLGDNSSYRELEKTFGKNAIAWDYNGKNIGSDKASKNLARQDNYYNSLNKILGSDPENALSSIKDIAKYDDEAYKARKDILDRMEQLQSKYDTEAITRGKARDEEILQANILGQTALIPKIKERYEAQDELAKLQQEFEVDGYKWTEERKLQYTHNTNILRLTAEGKFSEDQKKIFEKGYRDQYDQELTFVVLAKEQRIFQYKQALMTEAELVRERYRIEMLELSKLDIEERRIAMQAKTTAFIRGSLAPVGTAPIESDKGKSNTQLLQEETGRELLAMQNRHLAAQLAAKDNAEELLRIEKDYIAAKEQLHSEHDVKLVDARKADHDNQLQLYGQMLSQASTVWGDMTQMIKHAKGENSKTFKAMFLAQQSMAIAQQIINTELAAGATTAQTGIFGLPAASVIRGIGYASVGLIAAQTIAGFETGGYTGSGGRKDVAGVVHGQEYVLNAAATKRVGVGTLDAINSGKILNGGSSGGDVHISQTITFADGGAKVDTQGQKEVAQSLNNMMDAWARRESRQGGVLYKLARG